MNEHKLYSYSTGLQGNQILSSHVHKKGKGKRKGLGLAQTVGPGGGQYFITRIVLKDCIYKMESFKEDSARRDQSRLKR